MKNLTLILCLLLSAQVWSADITQDNIQGAWAIISMAGMPDEEGDMWEFEGNQFYQNLGGRRISPDPFVVKDNVIDLGYYQIKVLEFTGKTMKADMAGFVYELKKK
ncbi:hypothetical protein [Marinicella litoralis]|uniref:Lipocalin-like protein n=1 Tax=Marinicella litoralis TaxID=644220 RepID=A0A4R6Y0E0_9GAMM|nr:hypothetical protein [Marinicella litoralis]TDR22368.1 hypothetical protein C8D91_0856 [Marinicella litoralis]